MKTHHLSPAGVRPSPARPMRGTRGEQPRPHPGSRPAEVRPGGAVGSTVNSHDLTIGGYLAVLAGIALLQLLATRTSLPVPGLGDLLTRAMRTRTGRVGVLVAWAWIGLHFFAR